MGRMAKPQPFRKSAQVKLDASGNGVATVTSPGVWWRVKRTSVSTTQTDITIVPPQVRVYEGSQANAAAFIEGTFSGNGASSDTVHDMIPGDSITAQWSAGTPNTVATLTVAGLQSNEPFPD